MTARGGWARRGRRAAVALVVAVAASACAGPTRTLRLPSCAEEVEVEGQHRPIGDSEIVFDYGGSLPLSQTEVVVEGADGTTDTYVWANTSPDWLRVIGAGAAVVVGGAAVAFFLDEATVRSDPFSGPGLFWLVLSGGSWTLAATWLLTGWHPDADLDLSDRCEGDFGAHFRPVDEDGDDRSEGVADDNGDDVP